MKSKVGLVLDKHDGQDFREELKIFLTMLDGNILLVQSDMIFELAKRALIMMQRQRKVRIRVIIGDR